MLKNIEKIIKSVSSHSIMGDCIVHKPSKEKRNTFPFKGQTSPDIVGNILDSFKIDGCKVLDPFVGCGTTLLECLKRNIDSVGVDINPAAVLMSKTLEFSSMDLQERNDYLSKANKFLFDRIGFVEKSDYSSNSLSSGLQNLSNLLDVPFVESVLRDIPDDPIMKTVLLNIMFRYLSSRIPDDTARLKTSFNFYSNFVVDIPYSTSSVEMINCDARKMPFDDSSIDLIVTSLPYVHTITSQRKIDGTYFGSAMGNEIDLKQHLRSEIGFGEPGPSSVMLLVNYCIDICNSFKEMKRVLKSNSLIVIVVSRESKIRSIPFSSYEMICSIAKVCNGLNIVKRQERVYNNRFGNKVLEDVVQLMVSDKDCYLPDTAKDIAVYFLKKALPNVSDAVAEEINASIDESSDADGSPIFI